MGGALKIETDAAGAVKEAIDRSGWLDGEQVVAAGHLRQGKAPSMLAMVTGAGLIELIRPRRSKQLPRHFALAVTEQRVVAFKASGGKSENEPYVLTIRPGIEGSWDRDGIRITDLDKGEKSSGGVLVIGGESVPVARPNLTGEPNTDELLATLSS